MDISIELLEHFRLTEQQASFEVITKVSTYPEFIDEYKPNIPYQKINDGFELYVEGGNKKQQQYTETPPQYLEDDKERSVRRTRKKITDYIICNDFDLFCTFTFKDNRDDVIRCKKRMSTWLTNQKKQYGQFNYLIVAEYHKDKQSIHFHALLGGYHGPLTLARNHHTKQLLKRKGKQQYNLGSYRLGLNSAEEITSKLKAGYYLRKYITKEMILLPGKKRYWSSRGLKLPIVEYNPEPYYLDFEIIDVWWNELGSKVRYKIPEGFSHDKS